MENSFWFLTITTIFFAIISTSATYLEYDGWINIEVQHAIDPKDLEHFSYRSNISVSSLNSGLSSVMQQELTNRDIEKIKNLAESDNFYRLKAIVEYPNGSKRTFYTANKACSVLNSQLSEELWISVDASGFVNAITVSAAGGKFIECSALDLTKESKKFNTEVFIKHTEMAPVPDTASFIQKIEREREARERGENKDNRGFLAKYWMYIVPVVLLVFISGATNPEQQK